MTYRVDALQSLVAGYAEVRLLSYSFWVACSASFWTPLPRAAAGIPSVLFLSLNPYSFCFSTFFSQSPRFRAAPCCPPPVPDNHLFTSSEILFPCLPSLLFSCRPSTVRAPSCRFDRVFCDHTTVLLCPDSEVASPY